MRQLRQLRWSQRPVVHLLAARSPLPNPGPDRLSVLAVAVSFEPSGGRRSVPAGRLLSGAELLVRALTKSQARDRFTARSASKAVPCLRCGLVNEWWLLQGQLVAPDALLASQSHPRNAGPASC